MNTVPLPPVGGPEVQKPVQEIRKILSDAKPSDLENIAVAKKHKTMNGQQLLDQVTVFKPDQKIEEQINKYAKLLTMIIPVLQIFVSRKKEAGSRILIDAFVCALVGVIHDIGSHFMFVIPEITLASATGCPQVLESLDKQKITVWSGIADYGLAFGGAEGAEGTAILQLGETLFEQGLGDTKPSASKQSVLERQLQWTLIEAKRLERSKKGVETPQLIEALPQAIAQSMVCTKCRGPDPQGDNIPLKAASPLVITLVGNGGSKEVKNGPQNNLEINISNKVPYSKRIECFGRLFGAVVGFSMSLFDYPTIAKNPLPDTMASPEANVVQLRLYTSINDMETSHWALWAVFPSPNDDASRIAAQNLAMFLNTHEYLRYSSSFKAGKDIDIITRGNGEYTSIYSEDHPLPTWTRFEVKQGLVHSWQIRIGEDVTDQIDPAVISFDPEHLSKTKLKDGSKLWQKYFNSHHWTPHLRKLVDLVRMQASTKEDQERCFAITVLGANNEPRDRPGYSAACRALLSKGSDAEKAKERRNSKKNGSAKEPVNSTDGLNGHSHSQHFASGSPVGEMASVPVPPQPPTIYQRGTPSSAFHSAQTSATLSAPSGSSLSFPIGPDTHLKIPTNVGDVVEGEIGTQVLKGLTEPELDKFLATNGSGTLPEPSSGVRLQPPSSPLGSQPFLSSSIPTFNSPKPPSSSALDMESYTSE
ncbi:hypothetical protein M407DRAFT_12939, partial [Tulasnella calospora MUT 4182]